MNKIKAAREAANLTQKELSAKLGVSIDAVKSWDSGRRNTPPWVEALLLEKIKYINLGEVRIKISNVELAKMVAGRGFNYNKALGSIDAGRVPTEEDMCGGITMHEEQEVALADALEIVDNVCSFFIEEAEMVKFYKEDQKERMEKAWEDLKGPI